MPDQSNTTLAGPEFGIVHTMRPYVGFEAQYQGKSVSYPIFLCEANKPYDPLAVRGVPGIDPLLIAALPCVMGCRVMIWMPSMNTKIPGNPETYRLLIVWRFRNLFDHRNSVDRIPWHIAKQGAGVADTGPINPGPRTLSPACWESMIYTQTEPAAPNTYSPGLINVRNQLIQPCQIPTAPNIYAPIMPDGVRGAIEQGARRYTASPYRYLTPGWLYYETQAVGDELLLLYTRTGGGVWPNWDFGGVDENFAETLGAVTGDTYPDIGVYVSFGVSP